MQRIRTIAALFIVAMLSACATGTPAHESRFQSIQKSSIGGKFGSVSGEDYRRTTEGNPDRYIPQRK
jgi:hypothetical protein